MNINSIIRFYEELNQYIHKSDQKTDISVNIEKGTTVGALIESLGPPGSAVDLILVNGKPKGFDYILRDNDRVSVYPVFERLNIESVSVIPHSPLRQLMFVCDVHLGRLAKYLRMLGFDTLYSNLYKDEQLIRISNAQNRILLSRDRQLIQDKHVTRRYLISHADPEEQIREIISYFDLKNNIAPMTRCLKCNGLVRPVAKEAVRPQVDKPVFERNEEFCECMECGKLYWKGSHYDAMMQWIRKVLDSDKKNSRIL